MVNDGRRLLASLVTEVFQAESSGVEHCSREAGRLGDTPPGRAMYRLANDCSRSLPELGEMTTTVAQGAGTFGSAFGGVLSSLREKTSDLLLTRETSYRATLLGIHHGLDCVMLFESTAAASGDAKLALWAAGLLNRRRPLLEAATQELLWFGTHPSFALEPAKRSIIAKSTFAVAKSIASLRARS